MRTIEKILEYNLTHKERIAVYSCWICNWIGWKGYNLEKAIKWLLEYLPYFDKEKYTKLLHDFILIADEHDIQFRLQLWFTKSNFKFAYKSFKLLHKFQMKHRLSFSLFVFYTLQKAGKQFYYKKKRLD